jgi:hypothetical protein
MAKSIMAMEVSITKSNNNNENNGINKTSSVKAWRNNKISNNNQHQR